MTLEGWGDRGLPEPDRIVSRLDRGVTPVVHRFGGILKRPRLARGLGLVVMHHTGVPVKTRTYRPLTLDQVLDVAKAIDRWKLNEYNYLIDWQGNIIESAGEYQGAHTAGYNDRAYGVLFLNANEEAVSNRQVIGFRWLVGCLKWAGAINLTPYIVGHGTVGNTGCPGRVTERYDELVAPPWSPPAWLVAHRFVIGEHGGAVWQVLPNGLRHVPDEATFYALGGGGTVVLSSGPFTYAGNPDGEPPLSLSAALLDDMPRVI